MAAADPADAGLAVGATHPTGAAVRGVRLDVDTRPGAEGLGGGAGAPTRAVAQRTHTARTGRAGQPAASAIGGARADIHLAAIAQIVVTVGVTSRAVGVAGTLDARYTRRMWPRGRTWVVAHPAVQDVAPDSHAAARAASLSRTTRLPTAWADADSAAAGHPGPTVDPTLSAVLPVGRHHTLAPCGCVTVAKARLALTAPPDTDAVDAAARAARPAVVGILIGLHAGRHTARRRAAQLRQRTHRGATEALWGVLSKALTCTAELARAATDAAAALGASRAGQTTAAAASVRHTVFPRVTGVRAAAARRRTRAQHRAT